MDKTEYNEKYKVAYKKIYEHSSTITNVGVLMNEKGFLENERFIQSVFRALKILEFTGEHGKAIGLTQISKGIGLSKSTTHGLVSTLERMGYMQQDAETGKYSLGLKVFELGQAYISNLDLREIALPYMRELSSFYQETTHLAVLSQGEVIYIEKVDGPLSIGIRSQIGGKNPAYCTGVGKVLLSGMPDEKIEAMYLKKPFVKYTSYTITTIEKLLLEINNARFHGYAFDKEEIEIGLNCVAVPIKDAVGNIIAAISLSGPAHRLNSEKMEEVLARMLQVSFRISGRLGYRE